MVALSVFYSSFSGEEVGTLGKIALLTVFGVLIITWGISQWMAWENAAVPLHMLRQRTVASATFYIFFKSRSFVLPIYYLPIWFQAIKGDSAAHSVIHNLPAVLSTAKLGFQIIFGAAAGIRLKVPNFAVQTVLPEKDLSIAASLVVLTRSLSGAIFISVIQNVFSNHLASSMIFRQAVNQASFGEADAVGRVLEVYNDAIAQTFVVALALACVSIIGILGVE
ncbi:hypothetical protein BBP40_002234 [Aspergillus hancockii]|nr:hypothetical protein BBP40_002234 [Aspergillus hancockii]